MKRIRLLLLYLLAAPVMLFAGNGPDRHTAGIERIFVHTDRDIYIAGETIYFRLTLLNENSGTSSILSKIAYLLLRDSHSGNVAKVCIKVEGGTAYSSIALPDTLATGMYQLVAFTNWMRNSGKESYFTKEIIIANLFDKDLNAFTPGSQRPVITVKRHNSSPEERIVQSMRVKISAGKDAFDRGEKISFRLSFVGQADTIPINVSVSVHEDTPWKRKEDIPGYPDKKVETEFVQAQVADNLDYLPENDGQIIQGRVLDKQMPEGIAGCCMLLSAKDTALNLQYTYTDTYGLFRFRLNEYYQQKILVVKLKDTIPGREYRIEMDDKFAMQGEYSPSVTELTPELREYIRECQDIVRVQRSYRQMAEAVIQRVSPGNSSRPEIYYRPDYQVNPSHYEQLGDFTEIARELLPTVRTRKTNENWSIELVDQVNQGFFKEKPAIFLDGIYTHDIKQLIPMGSDMIKRIEVVNSPRICGSLYFPGILAVFSNDMVAATPVTSTGSISFQADPFLAYTLWQPSGYRDDDSILPDFRQLLYWNPSLEIKQGGKTIVEFPASRHTGDFIMDIRGFTASGNPVSASYRFRIY
jgi:hypothetical protein